MNYLPSRHYTRISQKGLSKILLRVNCPRSNNILIKQSRVGATFLLYAKKLSAAAICALPAEQQIYAEGLKNLFPYKTRTLIGFIYLFQTTR